MAENITVHERRARRLGITGEAMRPFLAMNDDDQQLFLSAKWRLEGVDGMVAARAAAMDMTPDTYLLHIKTQNENWGS